jgi:hypothetical protein
MQSMTVTPSCIEFLENLTHRLVADSRSRIDGDGLHIRRLLFYTSKKTPKINFLPYLCKHVHCAGLHENYAQTALKPLLSYFGYIYIFTTFLAVCIFTLV